MLSLAMVSIGLAFEALRRLWHSEDEVDGKLMSGVAGVGVLVNVVLALVLGVEHHVHLPGAGHDHSHGHGDHDEDEESGHCDDVGHNGSCSAHDHSHNDSKFLPASAANGHNHSQGHETTKLAHTGPSHYQAIHQAEVVPPGTTLPTQRNINLHAAYLHVLGDLAQSVAVLVAGLVIWWNPEWRLVDPICTLVFCAFVFYSTLGVLRSSISVLLEEVPPNIKWRDMFDAINGVEEVEKVHDLHIWSISQGNPTLSVHCMTKGDPELALERIYAVVKKRGIQHATIQVQSGNGSCITCTGDACDESRISQTKIIVEENASYTRKSGKAQSASSK